ncbi:MAG: YdeI/OmpD-associated family protein [Bacteroidia bacterium]
MSKINPQVDNYLIDGCMRCKYGATPKCKVNKWRTELEILRNILLESELKEELKWGAPCYTYKNKNVILLSALKDAVCISFLKGSLLEDKKNILSKAGENSHIARIIKLTSVEQINKLEKDIRMFINAAIEIEKKGLKIAKTENIPTLPEELENIFNNDLEYKKAFFALTPGRQRGYIIYFTQPKQSQSKIYRIEKCREKIMNGEGLNDAYKSQSKNKI